jgi:hypothetical protein
VAFSPSGNLLATANYGNSTVSVFSVEPPAASITSPNSGSTYTQGAHPLLLQRPLRAGDQLMHRLRRQ